MASSIRLLSSVFGALLLVVAHGCGDDGESGGDDDDGSGGAAGEGGSGSVLPVTTSAGPTGEGGGGAGPGSGGGGDTGGTTCTEIWACYDTCESTDCTTACHEAGSQSAQQADNALWECIFINHCDTQECVEQNCPGEQQACFGGG